MVLATMKPIRMNLSFRAGRSDFSLALRSCQESARSVEESLFEAYAFKVEMSSTLSSVIYQRLNPNQSE
jgi:hypothetical protein